MMDLEMAHAACHRNEHGSLLHKSIDIRTIILIAPGLLYLSRAYLSMAAAGLALRTGADVYKTT